jgi:ribosome maturation factor RimP
MQKHYLADIIEPVVEGLGFATVRILTIGDSNPTLQIMIEHINDEKELTVDDCAKVSRAISAVLDEKDPTKDRYTLEVSSPGLDRPLTKLEHFSRYKNYVIKLETIEPVEKRKRFKGIIKDVSSSGEITLEMETTEYKIAFDNVAKAKIVITDELWEQYLKSHKSAEV